MKNKITWAPIVPLIGGFPLGAEKTIGKAPEAVYSYNGFWANDSLYMNYQNETLGRDVPYVKLDEVYTMQVKNVDIVVATCPCAALSMLNTGQTKETKGADAKQNDWMYKATRDTLSRIKPKVMIHENAPCLYTQRGEPVATRLFEIAKEFGYSVTMYKTTTSLHGLPQNRDRTFYFIWKSDKAPIISWYKRERLSFPSWLEQIPEDAEQQDIIINDRIGHTESYWNFLKYKFPNDDIRNIVREKNYSTTFNYVNGEGLLQEAHDWFVEQGDEQGIKLSSHAIKKFAMGKGIWDGSTHVFRECMNAVIGRNMADTIHPVYDRSLTIREALHMMGFPSNFYLVGGKSNMNKIAQNVPVYTASDMVAEAVKFINGELSESNTNFVKQNNHKQVIDVGTQKGNDLSEFF